MIDRYCSHCQFIVQTKVNDTPQDKQAKLRGYCSDVCRQLTANERHFIMEREAAR